MIVEAETIATAFMKAEIGINSIDVIEKSNNSFGDFVANVDTNIGRMRVVRDRGQFFVDSINIDGVIVPFHVIYPSIVAMYSHARWSLEEVLAEIKKCVAR